MKILYFTGTGNCLSVAKHFDAELLSIPQLVKDNIYEIENNPIKSLFLNQIQPSIWSKFIKLNYIICILNE